MTASGHDPIDCPRVNPVIRGPGFYTSKAGKCEVVAINGNHAIGWSHMGGGVTWFRDTGKLVARDSFFRPDDYDITSVWTDKPKPIEATFNIQRLKSELQATVGYGFGTVMSPGEFTALLHLAVDRVAEDRGP